MKISEIIPLTESISLTEHHSAVSLAIWNGILETIYGMVQDFKDPKFDPLRNIDVYKYEGSVFSLLEPILKEYFEIHLKQHLEDALSKVSRNIVGVGSTGRWVNVAFKDTGKNLGWAESDNTVGLNKSYYLDKLIVKLIDNVQNIVIDNYNGETVLETLEDYIRKMPSDEYRQTVLIAGGSRGDTKIINNMTGTVLHELVHVKQHLIQQKLGRDRTQYRSYLQKSKEEFNKAQGEEDSPLWYKLHASSPQEIAAHVHNIALNIINDFDFDRANYSFELGNVEADTIMHYVKDFLVNRIGTPKTRKELMVFKKYLKGVYQEVMGYRQRLYNELKQREQQRDREFNT